MRLQVTTQTHDKFATFTIDDAATGEMLLPLIEAEVSALLSLLDRCKCLQRSISAVQDAIQSPAPEFSRQSVGRDKIIEFSRFEGT